MTIQTWTYILVGMSFALYIGIAVWSKAKSTSEFYSAGGGVSPLANGLATAADWMSAASFMGMAGSISFLGRDGSQYLMGWTGGYVLLALLLAPYLRKFGKFTVPDFVGARYYSQGARLVALFCAIFVSFTYVAGQMRGVGVVFSRFLNVSVEKGVIIGMVIVLIYSVLGGMKGITYTQVAQYCVLIFAFTVPAIFISLTLTGHVVPQIGFGSQLIDADGAKTGLHLLDKLDGLSTELGFGNYTGGSLQTIDLFCITVALMCGTAGLPHVIIRFFTVPRVRDARLSAGYALFFIALLYTTAPAIAAFARLHLLQTVSNAEYKSLPPWFAKWENTGLIAWVDKNNDGRIQVSGAHPANETPEQMIANKGKKADAFGGGKPVYLAATPETPNVTGKYGQRLLDLTKNPPNMNNTNELYVDNDIMVLANPEIYNLPNWVIALVAAGALAAALSTAAGLLLVISTSISHDLLKSVIMPHISEKQELMYARIAATIAVIIAGIFGIYPPGFVAEVVAFAFGLAASSFFPIIVLGIFWKRMNKQGAITGMCVGVAFTTLYIIYFKFPGIPTLLHIPTTYKYLWGISPNGIGAIGMALNTVCSVVVSLLTPPPPAHIQHLVEDIRVPRGAGEAQAH